MEWVLVVLLVIFLAYLYSRYNKLKRVLTQRDQDMYNVYMELQSEIEQRNQVIAELKSKIETHSLELFERWRTTSLETQSREIAEVLFQRWKQEEEKKIRKDAIMKSKAVITGKVTEHLIPYFPDFNYNPKDARFIGSPIDIIVFDGLSDGEVREIVFIEVKTGKTASLSVRERQVRNCILNKNVMWRKIHHEDEKTNTKRNISPYIYYD